METYTVISCIAPPILNLTTRWRSVVNFTPRPLYPWKRSPPTIEKEAGLDVLEKGKTLHPCRDVNRSPHTVFIKNVSKLNFIIAMELG
jgi:hypothetical protein